MNTNINQISESNFKLPVPVNDNQEDRYMSLDLEPKTLDAAALIEDVSSLVQASLAKKYKMRKELRSAVSATIADLIMTAAKASNRYGFRPMGTATFTNSLIGHSAFKQAASALVAVGLMEVIPAQPYNTKQKADERGTATRYRATGGLLEMALGYGVTPHAWRTHFRQRRMGWIKNPILLRSSTEHYKGRKVPGKPVWFDPYLGIVQYMGRQVNDINGFLFHQDLDLGDYAHRFYHRIFSQGDCWPVYPWDRGGRLYSPGLDSYQQAPSDERASFRFNGEATVEVDIGSSFLTIFRVKSGISFDPTHDPYDIPGLRRFASKSWTVATFGHDKHHTRWPDAVKKKYHKAFMEKKEGDWGTGDLQKDHPFGPTHKLMLKALPELADWSNSTIRWGDLQFWESEAVIDAVHILAMKYGVPALPVHDSIRVPVSKQELAMQVLSDAFFRHIGVRPTIKAK